MTSTNVHDLARAAGIVPDLVDSIAPSPTVVRMSFGGAGVAENGRFLTPEEAASAPAVEIGGPPGSWVLLMFDPDVPSPEDPARRAIVHWIVNGVSGDADAGRTLATYRGPNPPSGSPPHRYILLAWRRDPGTSDAASWEPTAGGKDREHFDVRANRDHFDVREWARANGLGAPDGLTWFVSGRD